MRSFKPDFLLVRQNPRDANEDHRNLLYGFQYGNIPSVNSLESIYNFQVSVSFLKTSLELIHCISILIQDRPWTFAQLVKIQDKLGKDKFPLIEQTYFPGPQEMVSIQ